MENFSYFMPTRLFFGSGALKRLAKLQLPAGKGLIITGGSSTTRLGYVDRVQEQLTNGGHESIVYNKVQPNPTIENVRECAALARAEGCSFIVGLGGGSSIDTAKAVSIMATNDGDWWDYIYGGTGRGKRMEKDGLPLVAITTTAGTGTEADPWTVITNGDEKIGGGGDKTFPTFSIIDPDLMVSVPAKLTAYQGFDALFHACEGYIATIASPISEMFSLESIRLIGENLVKAVQNGEDTEARSHVALANTLSGFVETLSSCTSEHSIAHALSALHPSVTHGAALTAISKAYFARFTEVRADKLVRMAQALGCKDATAPADFIRALGDLQTACGVDAICLSEGGVSADRFAEYAANARATMGGLFAYDARPLTDDDVVAILTESYR